MAKKYKEGGMSGGTGDFANMPTKSIMKPYPKSPSSMAGYPYDDLAGIDYQMMQDEKGQKLQKYADKD